MVWLGPTGEVEVRAPAGAQWEEWRFICGCLKCQAQAFGLWGAKDGF